MINTGERRIDGALPPGIRSCRSAMIIATWVDDTPQSAAYWHDREGKALAEQARGGR